jgi:hypothetical protein
MLHRIKLLLLAVVAIGAITASTASAATLNASPAGNITSASLGKVTFTGGAINIRCNLTMTGTLAARAAATAGTQIGEMSRVEWAACEGGNVRSVNNLPYRLTFNRLTASGIEFTVNSTNFTLSVTIFGIVVDCTYGGNVPALVELISGRTGLIRILTNTLNRTAGSSSCPASGSMSGTFGLSPQQTITLTEP